MKRLQAQVRATVIASGYDLPDRPILPPMDVVDDELRKLGALASRLARALGRETDLHVYQTTVPAVRSLTEIRRAVAALLYGNVELATQLGLDIQRVLTEARTDTEVKSNFRIRGTCAADQPPPSIRMSIATIKTLVSAAPALALVHVQIKSHEAKTTKGDKPFLSIGLVDATGDFTLRVWSDHAAFHACGSLVAGDAIEVKGRFKMSDFGLEAEDWSFRMLDPAETDALMRGSPELIAKQDADWQAIVDLLRSMHDGPLKTLCELFVKSYEGQFRRAAAARGNHHARRGGLVEHVSMMMQSASALAVIYGMHRDLVIAGVLFHDCGKMWENQYEERGFVMPFSAFSECYGHITIGVMIAHKLWEAVGATATEKPDVRLRDLLCHLILSHHGQLEWGSPVEPKLPEACLLHYVDNLDAKVEMMRAGATGKVLAPGVIEAPRPLRGSLLTMPKPAPEA